MPKRPAELDDVDRQQLPRVVMFDGGPMDGQFRCLEHPVKWIRVPYLIQSGADAGRFGQLTYEVRGWRAVFAEASG